MQHLVVVAHPSAESFTMAVTRVYVGELARLGHQVVTCDLYRSGFNPVLAAHELAAGHPGFVAADADVGTAQRLIRRSDVLTVIYPLWWLSMPAILKGYIDRVFARGFAYQARGGVVEGLLGGKSCVLITLSGAPLPMLMERGRWNAVQVLQDGHIFRSAGFGLLEHLHLDRIEPQLPMGLADEHFERVRSCAVRHFSGSDAPGAALGLAP